MLAVIAIGGFVASSAFAGFFLWLYIKWRLSPLFCLPGPRCNFTLQEWVFGNTKTIDNEPFMAPQQRWLQEAGPQTRLLHYTVFFGRHFICVMDVDGVKQVLSHKDGVARPRFIKGLGYLGKLMGRGLVTIDGADWQRHRKIIEPAFHSQLLKEALNSCIPDYVDRMINAWKVQVGSEIDLPSHFAAMSLDILGTVAFSHDFRSMDSVEQWAKDANYQVELNDPLIQSLYANMMPSKLKMLLIRSRLLSLEKIISPESHQSMVILNRAVDDVVKRARSRHDSQDESSSKAKCFLQLLFDAELGSPHGLLSHEELREETKTFLIAGHQTTSTLCVWAIYCLLRYPEKQNLVLEDIKNICPKGCRVTLESTERMKYLDAFLKEVLRLFPPVGMIMRQNVDWITLLGEKIPPRTRLVIPIYLLHRHPDYWSEPNSFKPERWLGFSQTDRKFQPFAFLPFGAGSRNCIGQRFAMWEAKLILAPIIRDFEMMLSPSLHGVNLKLVNLVSMKSIPSIKILARPRE